MTNKDEMNQKSNIVIYTTEDGLTKIETTFESIRVQGAENFNDF